MQSMIFAFVACSLLASVSSFKMPSSLLKAASLKASPTHDAPGFDTHKAVETIPASLVKEIDGNDSMRKKMETLVRSAQDKICKGLEEVDGKAKFHTDGWVRESGGGGITRVMSGGNVFEKAGVNVAVVYGKMPSEALLAATERGVNRAAGMKPGEQVPFFACGISSVIHPSNPHCPTMHYNYRYFETDGGLWWFGGGTDITPVYLVEDDMKHFHGTYKNICDKHDPKFYPEFKAWADKYYVVAHRGETRGLGGIFFDDLNDRDADKIHSFCSDCLDGVLPAYTPIIQKHKNDAFTPEEKHWQLLRRGRYAEFNLIYDRGTIFGLKTGGRVESIMMTIPKEARWDYCHTPAPGSKEEEIMKLFKNPRDWV